VQEKMEVVFSTAKEEAPPQSSQTALPTQLQPQQTAGVKEELPSLSNFGLANEPSLMADMDGTILLFTLFLAAFSHLLIFAAALNDISLSALMMNPPLFELSQPALSLSGLSAMQQLYNPHHSQTTAPALTFFQEAVAAASASSTPTSALTPPSATLPTRRAGDAEAPSQRSLAAMSGKNEYSLPMPLINEDSLNAVFNNYDGTGARPPLNPALFSPSALLRLNAVRFVESRSERRGMGLQQSQQLWREAARLPRAPLSAPVAKEVRHSFSCPSSSLSRTDLASRRIFPDAFDRGYDQDLDGFVESSGFVPFGNSVPSKRPTKKARK